jgi:hypothetical protein
MPRQRGRLKRLPAEAEIAVEALGAEGLWVSACHEGDAHVPRRRAAARSAGEGVNSRERDERRMWGAPSRNLRVGRAWQAETHSPSEDP